MLHMRIECLNVSMTTSCYPSTAALVSTKLYTISLRKWTTEYGIYDQRKDDGEGMESTTLIGSSLVSCDVNKQKMGMYSKHTYTDQIIITI